MHAYGYGGSYSANYSANQYRANSVNTSPLQLVVMCYDGMIRFLKKAGESIESKDIEGKVKFINKTIAIIDELQNSLDFAQGGEVARNLDRVYTYWSNELMKVGMNNDTEILNHIIDLVKDLRVAWAKISEENAAVPGRQQAQTGITITG